MIGFAIGAVALLMVVLGVGAYNVLIRRRNGVDNAFAGIDTQLMMRYELIPNLVAVVRQYASHESATLQALTGLRTQAQGTGLGPNDRVQLDNRISQAMSGLLARVENHPNLKAAENFLQLQRALNEVEERIAASRRFFNTAATDYNNAVELFPLNLIATRFGFGRRALFTAPDASRASVSVAAAMRS